MKLEAYPYVGPERVRLAALGHPGGSKIETVEDARTWLSQNPDDLTEGATWVVDLTGGLRLAPRRSEHVACAEGAEVFGAGELRLRRSLRVEEVSNQSTGYCPDVTCWGAVAAAIQRAGLIPPERLWPAIIFRRCTRCAQINLVKDSWFVCVFCNADLPAAWNVSARRTSDLP